MKLIMSVLLSLLLAIISIKKRAINFWGTILATIFSIIITYCGGIYAYLILFLTFLLTAISSKIKVLEKNKIMIDINEKNGKKDSIQIIANVFVGTLATVLFYFTKNMIFLTCYTAVMAASIADSVSSEIGILTKGNTYNILNLKKIEKGKSGGVSFLGLFSAALVTLLYAILYAVIIDCNIKSYLCIFLFGFLGSIFDSIMGAKFQAKYKCLKCNKITERKIHCDSKTILYSGIKFVNNDFVNISNNIFVFIITYFVLSL